MANLSILGPNIEALAIVRLHLERLPIMSPEERALFLRVSTCLMAPPTLLVTADEQPPLRRL